MSRTTTNMDQTSVKSVHWLKNKRLVWPRICHRHMTLIQSICLLNLLPMIIIVSKSFLKNSLTNFLIFLNNYWQRYTCIIFRMDIITNDFLKINSFTTYPEENFLNKSWKQFTCIIFRMDIISNNFHKINIFTTFSEDSSD